MRIFWCMTGLMVALLAAAHAQMPAFQKKELPSIKASLDLPEGWQVKEEGEDGVFVFQIGREDPEGGASTAGFNLTVTTKVPERANMKASEYAKDLLVSSELDKVEMVEDGPWKCFSTEYQIEGDGGNVEVASLAKANDQTGTLYFLSWQSRESEKTEMDPVREKIFSSLKLDPGF